tara:strand:- start:176 stop:943 length:768 start_codon:yes stop_codon:yes gene_type:complete
MGEKMAKLPKMNLFVDAFNSDTVYLTEEELGLYMRMIFYAWTHDGYLPDDKEIIYCLPKKPNDALVDKILKLFWTKDDKGYFQKRLLKEYMYAMEVSEKASNAAKSRYANALQTQSERTATNTITKTITNTNKDIYTPEFDKFWGKVCNKVSKGIAFRNFTKLPSEWIKKSVELAEMYNKYYENVKDKEYAKQPAFWLSAQKYLDEKVEDTSMTAEEFKDWQWKNDLDMRKKGLKTMRWSVDYIQKLDDAIANGG